MSALAPRISMVVPPPPGHRNLTGESAAEVAAAVRKCLDAIESVGFPRGLNVLCSVLASVASWTEDPIAAVPIIADEAVRCIKGVRQ